MTRPTAVTRQTAAQIRDALDRWWPQIRARVPRLNKRLVFDAASKIAHFDPAKEQRAAAAKRKKARLLIWEAHILLATSQLQDPNSSLSGLIDTLERVRDDMEPFKKRRKGASGPVFKWSRKLYTAATCYEMLKQYTDEELSTSGGGTWVWLSGGLFEMATGERGVDMYKACLKWDHLRQRGA